MKTTLEEINNLVTFSRDEEGNLRVFNVKGAVQGDVNGDVKGYVKGNVEGNVKGSVRGNVEGNVWGTVQGDVKGTVWGDVKGNVWGNVEGAVQGDVRGYVRGEANCNNRLVSVALLEMLTQIACDYINPDEQAHHGVPPVSQADTHRAIKEAGEILDANH